MMCIELLLRRQLLEYLAYSQTTDGALGRFFWRGGHVIVRSNSAEVRIAEEVEQLREVFALDALKQTVRARALQTLLLYFASNQY